MLRSVNELINYVIEAQDGEIGRCKDFLFGDRHWAIRYMVADTRKWLPGRKVLVSPIALGDPDWKRGRFPVMLTCRQIEESPPLDEDEPVSRQYETRWFDYYGWPYYWAGGNVGVKLTVSAIKDGPKYDPTEPINREYETRLYDYHGRPHYWE